MIIRFPGGLRKALTLSYDDGVEQDVLLMDILRRHGLKCTFNLNSGCFAAEGTVWPAGQVHRRMTERAAAALDLGSGHEVAVHTLTHPDLTKLQRGEVIHEVDADRRNLERIFGGIVRGIQRPDGNYHCYNVVGDCVFDLTSEQFGDEKLIYSEDDPEQFREVHFAKEEKKARYEDLKRELDLRFRT